MRTAYIGMGGNLPSWAGPAEATLAAAALRLESFGCVLCRSSLYSTSPVGFADQPRFVNAVVALETELEPQELLAGLMALEQEFGRDRANGFTNGPRTLDLDILVFGDLKISEPRLDIPHPRLAERAFVLLPLCEIAPQLLEPRTGKTVSELLLQRFPFAENESHEVVKIQSDGWRAGTERPAAEPDEPARPTGCDDHGNHRG